MPTPLLPIEERQKWLPDLEKTGWGALPDRDALRKIWKFRSFSEAWAFMSRAALAAEKANHHPEWTNRFNIVEVTLVTHDCAGLSMLDIDLARAMDRFAGEAAVVRDHLQLASCLCEERAARQADGRDTSS